VLLAGLARRYGIVRSGESANAATTKAKKAAAGQLVDQSALATARQWRSGGIRPRTSDRKNGPCAPVIANWIWRSTLRYVNGCAPTGAVPRRGGIQARLQQAAKTAANAAGAVTQLTAEAAKASGSRKDDSASNWTWPNLRSISPQ